MKARPRSVEREVANDWLTPFFLSRGWSPVERIPVLGRTGPDIDINESKLVIDVKSRKAISEAVFLPKGVMADFGGGLIACRLDELDKLFSAAVPKKQINPGIVVPRYWEHMDEWRKDHYPEGVSCIILHKPGKPLRCCTVIIHAEQRSALWQDVP